MNTFEARALARDLGHEALSILDVILVEKKPPAGGSSSLHALLKRVREALPDAGYPAESTWRALQRAAIGIDTWNGTYDMEFWRDVREDLNDALSTLEGLVGGGRNHDTDVYLVS